MKKMIFSLASFLTMSSAAISFASHHPNISHNCNHVNLEVHRHDYAFSTVFTCFGDKDYGTVYKSSFHMTTHYDLYSSHGKYKGKGVSRFFTLGAIYNWGREIDIYDKHDNYIGFIDGQFFTDAKAKFSMYDADGKRFAIAYLDKESTAFTVIDAYNEFHYIAYLKRHFVDDAPDHWKVSLYSKPCIDSRILKVFAAFAVDTQDSFKPDL